MCYYNLAPINENMMKMTGKENFNVVIPLLTLFFAMKIPIFTGVHR